MTTPIYPLNLTITPSPSGFSRPPTITLSLPETLSPSQIQTILSGTLRANSPTETLEPIPVYIQPPPPDLPSPGTSSTTTTTTTPTQPPKPTKRLLHLNPYTDVLLLLNLPSLLSSSLLYPPGSTTPASLSRLLPLLSRFRRIAVPFDPALEPEPLLQLWPEHFPHLEDCYVVVDTGLHPEILRRDENYTPDTIETFVSLEGKCYDVYGDAEDRAWVVAGGKGTGDGVVKGFNEGLYRKEMGEGGTGMYQAPRGALLGLVRE
ncbi:hypothetical protein B0T21DRAFT_432232 [Apiosordaria backusii]|uniref:Uncharacterized protein n=1 Tax=Apiosordaria backusii TaxID=314023 RepID=A0AA39ZPZ3_9PEZI|nr:hypothetical protein B0T21DRAFT_432232 [Apiosordaria backusii]